MKTGGLSEYNALFTRSEGIDYDDRTGSDPRFLREMRLSWRYHITDFGNF